MEISFSRCKAIADTLPIGLYTGRRIPVEMDDKIETSMYSPMEDKIIVSYSIIAHRLQTMPEGSCDEEEAVRSMLYHEVSHAILTPEQMRPDASVNIFEDERIENTLKNYYHGVNFRKQLYDIHGGKPPKATDPTSAFFNAVRFGLGTEKIQNHIQALLKKYALMNRTAPRWNESDTGYCDYTNAIHELYREIEKEFKKEPDAFNTQDSNESMKQMDDTGSQKQGTGKGKPSDSKDENSESEPSEEGSNDNYDIGRSTIPPISVEDIKKIISKSLTDKPDMSDAEIQKLNEFQKTVELIIGNFNKKNHGGSGINSYSGVFNPRNVTRKDYRFFDKAMSTQGNNKFGTCHLNLIIDCSGSFSPNVPLTNGIIAVLTEVERKNRNFSLDVAFINHDYHVCESIRERRLKAYGGNDVPADMKERLLQLQKPQTCNYNIILFDGDAICEYDHGHSENCRRFGAFDMKQTTLITDPDNERHMSPAFKSAKVVVTEKYTSELIKHITNALTIAFG